MTRRLMPPVGAADQTIIANGRAYSAQPGSVVDLVDADAQILTANSWIDVGRSGATSWRPSNPVGRDRYIDTTLNEVITWDGASWRSVIDGTAA